MSDQPTNYIAWLAKARNDILTIENNIAGSRVPWDAVCFHAQQAAEKTLKAFLIFHGRVVARTHDLVALLSACAQIDPMLAGCERDCQATPTPFPLAIRMIYSSPAKKTGTR